MPSDGRNRAIAPGTARPARRRRGRAWRRLARCTLVIGALAIIVGPGAPAARATEDSVEPLTQTALALTADPVHGHAQFARYCARCHGASGRGDVNRRIPVLANQRFAYLVRQLASLSEEARDSANMHHALSATVAHDPQTWADVAAYLSTARAPSHTQAGDGRHVALGEATYRILCASCHHDDAWGDDDGFVPSLRNQNYAYLLSQMGRIPALHRRGIDENFAALIRSLKPDEAAGLADYLSRQRGPTPRQ